MKGADEVRGKDEMEVSTFELPDDGEHPIEIGSDVQIHVNQETQSKSLKVPFNIMGGANEGMSFNSFFSLNGKSFSNKQLVTLMEFTQILPEIEAAFPADVEPNDDRVVNMMVARLSGRRAFITTKKSKSTKSEFENLNIIKWRKAKQAAQVANAVGGSAGTATTAAAPGAVPPAGGGATGW